ncbi:hypothetical protein QBC40DRAFT_326100 [Triangularia verruculosa]|uniref:Uncharacterized protein n=1 Tax=Triangularia verruculosa TaxID=2587418 RepID=A0AAN6XI73_9PEZI|nr:hypothetical protein QBC40DRAFT_326100 [Triangularia verruculosa]
MDSWLHVALCTHSRITVYGGPNGFNISGVGGHGQGTGSVSIIDSTLSNVAIGILTNSLPASPNIALDNTVFENVAWPVVAEGAGTIMLFENSTLWATGKGYNGSEGSSVADGVEAPGRGEGLKNDVDGKLYVRSRPQYETHNTGAFLIATTGGGCQNDATGEQASCLNMIQTFTILRRHFN